MTRRVVGRAWLSALIAVFLVAILPACWFDAKAAAAADAGLVSPGGGNSDEEREDHLRHGACIHATARVRPAQPVRPPVVRHAACEVVRGWQAQVAPVMAIAAATPHWLACSKFSVRRLI